MGKPCRFPAERLHLLPIAVFKRKGKGTNMQIASTMKNVALACLMAACAAPAMAEWTKVGEVANYQVSYIDYDTIRKNGNLRKVWGINDLKSDDPMGFISNLFKMELDCKEEKVRILTMSRFHQNMAQGMPAIKVTPAYPEWEFVPPNSQFSAILKVVCAK